MKFTDAQIGQLHNWCTETLLALDRGELARADLAPAVLEHVSTAVQLQPPTNVSHAVDQLRHSLERVAIATAHEELPADKTQAYLDLELPITRARLARAASMLGVETSASI